ncbi:MAG: HDIG domain-containing metalloprotein [Dehalococcoidia bacterium]
MPDAALDRLAGRAAYRARQFLRGLRPMLLAEEIADARGRLSPAEFTLFLHAEPRDRRHACDLLHALRREGVSEAALVAALLHDVGKGRLSVWSRVLFVLATAASPRLVPALAAEDGPRWRRELWRLQHHARLGAAMLREAGSDARVVEIVARHTGAPPPDDRELARFIEVDDRL